MHFTAVPDWAAQAIVQGTEDDLKRWSARLVKAKVFREVFADVITIPPNTC